MKYRRLTCGFTKNAGRNNSGKITVNHKRSINYNYIGVDFFRRKSTCKSYVLNIIRDFRRTSFSALIKFSNGAFSYISCAHGILPGSMVRSHFMPESSLLTYKVGFSVMLKYLVPGSIFFNVEKFSNSGYVYSRSAGTYCMLLELNEDSKMCKIRLPSGLLLDLEWSCTVILGRNSNIWNYKHVVGKAGRSFLLGKRPSVRGVAMNPVDHPHGGRTKTNSPEVTPWGKITKFNR